MEYNQKLVGRHGELYRYSLDRYAAYCHPKTGRKLLRLPETVKVQDGDIEMTVTFPIRLLEQVKRLIRVPVRARVHRD